MYKAIDFEYQKNLIENAVKSLRRQMIVNDELKPEYSKEYDVIFDSLTMLEKMITEFFVSASGAEDSKKSTEFDFEQIMMKLEKKVMSLHKQMVDDDELKHEYSRGIDTIVETMLDVQEMISAFFY